LQGDGPACSFCFGSTAPGGDTPVTESTLFRLASMTKPITAFAVLLLLDLGLLALEDPVAKYIPACEDIHLTAAGENGQLKDLGAPRNILTLRHLLTHTSGICDTPEKLQTMTDADRATVEATTAYLARIGLDYDPGSMTRYSGTHAFDLLAQIIENVSGVPYPDFLQQEIFSPCGMKDTAFVPTEEQWARMIAMHDRKNEKSIVGKTTPGCVFAGFPCTHFLGGAGLVSTLRDYMAFAQMLLNGGVSPAGRLISEETLGQMRTPQVSEDIMPGEERWGLGVRVITKESYGDLPVGTFGWSGAYGTHFWVDPENKIAAVFMRNSLYDGGSGSRTSREFEKAVHAALEE